MRPTKAAHPPIDIDAHAFDAWRAGDARAGATLVQRYHRQLTRYFERRCHDRAEDLAQETMLACIRARNRLDEPRAFRRYAFVIARRLLARDIARRDREHSEPQRTEVGDGVGSVDPAKLLRVYAALDALPRIYREAIVHYYIEGRCGRELAEHLGVPEGTVRTRLRRGLAQLRATLGARTPEPLGATAQV